MFSRRSLALLLVAASLAACANPAVMPAVVPAVTPAEPTLRRLLAEQAAAWNRHDAHAWVAPFAQDAEFINILGMALEGRAEIERRHAELFSGIFSQSKVVVTIRKVRMLSPEAAVVETDYALRDYARLPPGIRATEPDGALLTRLKYVWALGPEGWRVVAAQNTAILK